MAAAGVRGTLLKPASPSDLEIGIRSDVTWSETRSEAATSVSCGNLEAARVGTIRTRLAVDGARTWELNPGRTLTPSLELGLRHDEGDAETGLGLEAGARLRYLDAATGVALEAGVRRLLVHEDDGVRGVGRKRSNDARAGPLRTRLRPPDRAVMGLDGKRGRTPVVGTRHGPGSAEKRSTTTKARFRPNSATACGHRSAGASCRPTQDSSSPATVTGRGGSADGGRSHPLSG